MTRYFFELRQGDHRLKDERGEDFPTAAQAEDHGYRVAAELARNQPRSILNGNAVVVTDENEVEIALIRLDDVGAVRSRRQDALQLAS